MGSQVQIQCTITAQLPSAQFFRAVDQHACKGDLSNSLFFVGEFGWNDYDSALLAGRGVDEARPHTPEVVRMICAATQKLIDDGARTVVVSGVSPMGCTSGNLVLFASSSAADYEPDTGCLRSLNLLSMEHNRQLRQALAQLVGRNPGARIIYGDFYTPIAELAATLRGGGRYNFNVNATCGMAGASTACEDPSAYVNWDGIYLTEAAYHHVADGWLRGQYAHPPILRSYSR
ncbi:hypothetical protein E2562_037856 [Oryza meyeriana var. granulata]|uniref:GDSL esterase/lipase n=1 Tax=Oryza meyeriana var. granulata TaxID=110450 RepID=A0A6G1E861_9ORYZ|nr:hypothetical protein E2562_037856 [Oryza meyeriana var. granulata]